MKYTIAIEKSKEPNAPLYGAKVKEIPRCIVGADTYEELESVAMELIFDFIAHAEPGKYAEPKGYLFVHEVPAAV